MSWAAHQFEVYAVQAHLPKKMRGKVSFWGIFLGDFTPDFLSKFWVYGITINGRHYGAEVPHKWHRGWPGMGVTHTLFLGAVLAGAFWLWKRNRAFTVGYLLGYAAHALTDVNDSVGTILLFPFSTLNWSVQTWAYAATIEGGKYLDAAAYYSSLGLMMDLFWLVSRAGVLARAHPRLLAHADRPGRRPGVGVVRQVPPRARAARAVPGDVLLRRVPDDLVECLGPSDRGLPLRPLVDRAVLDRGALAPARQPVDRRSGDAGAARSDLLGREQALGADGPRRGKRRARPASPAAG